MRRPIEPPAGFQDGLSRRQAAALLGLPSDFKLRQMEKEGRLHPVRGAMGAAFYSKAEVLALRARLGAKVVHRIWSDAELVALLRESRGGGGPGMTVADLVIETGISISRAVEVHRFWLRHDSVWEPSQGSTPSGCEPPLPHLPPQTLPRTGSDGQSPSPLTRSAPLSGEVATERRGGDRLARDALLKEMRHPDPRVREAAFEKLREGR